MPSCPYFTSWFGLALEGLLVEVHSALWGGGEDALTEDWEVVTGLDGFGPSHGKL